MCKMAVKIGEEDEKGETVQQTGQPEPGTEGRDKKARYDDVRI